MASSADLAATLLELAAEDELMAKSLLPVEGVTDAGIGLHGVEFPFTHDLDGLVRLCKKNDIEVPADLAGVDALSPFAVAVRYGTSQSTPLDREQALQWAGSAVAWARTIIEDADGGQRAPVDQPSASD
jgi:HEPN domain